MTPSNLLAQKCLMSPQAEEIEALLTLIDQGNLDVKWHKINPSGRSLLELALKNVNISTSLTKKIITQAQSQKSLNLLSPLGDTRPPFFTFLLNRNDLWETFSEELIRSPLTKDQFVSFLNHPNVQNFLLSEQWKKFTQKENSFPPEQFKKLKDFRAENYWMGQTSETDFKSHRPDKITPKQLLTFFKVSLPRLDKDNNQKRWVLNFIVSESKSWKQWSEQDWINVWSSQPRAGFFQNILGDFYVSNWPSFLKGFNPSNNPRSFHVFTKEINALINKQTESKSLFSGGRDYSKAQNIIRSSSKTLERWATILLPQQNHFSDGLFYGAIQQSQSSTKIDSKAIQSWQNLSINHIDDFVDQIKSSVSFKKSNINFPWLQHDILGYFIHQYVLASTGKNHLNPFVSSLDFTKNLDQTISKQNQGDLALKLVQVGMRICQDQASPDDVNLAGAKLFWQSVFLIPQANQHYWLKKASDVPNLCQKLDSWHNGLSEKLEAVNTERKRTKEISSLLTKMSIVNEIDTSSNISKKSSRRM